MKVSPLVGSQVGGYRILAEIGSGAMACVYEAEHLTLNKRVALKVLTAVSSPSAVARFAREGRIASRARHPHVVEVIDFGVDSGVPFLAMELVEGPTLAALLSAGKPLPVPRVLDIILPVVSAIAHANRAGIVHRDLKPANILLGNDHFGFVCPKVTDFGVSKNVETDGQPITTDGSIVGTIAYMAPEHLRNASAADHRSDQYGLAAVLYHSLTGTLPYRGDSTIALIGSIQRGQATPPHEVERLIPTALGDAVMRAMRLDPAERFESMHAFGAALLPFAQERTWGTWAREFSAEARSTAGGTLDEPGPGAEGRSVSDAAFSRIPNALRSKRRRTVGFALALASALGCAAVAFPDTGIAHGASGPSVECARIHRSFDESARDLLAPEAGSLDASSTALGAPRPPGARLATAPAVRKVISEVGTNGAPILE